MIITTAHSTTATITHLHHHNLHTTTHFTTTATTQLPPALAGATTTATITTPVAAATRVEGEPFQQSAPQHRHAGFAEPLCEVVVVARGAVREQRWI
jgi:hypothetical protein